MKSLGETTEGPMTEKNKNIMSKLGFQFTDDDYREEFSIPDDVDVNEFMFNMAETSNINYYVSELGMTEKEAKAKARARTAQAKSMAAKNISK